MERRIDGRLPNALRPVRIGPNFLDAPDGSALITWGKTIVLCTASLSETVPSWMAGRGMGWVTAEYAMLPGSTSPRSPREVDHLSGRTQEIRRLIGRSLRAAVNLAALGERMVIVDCDVLQADGGTRTASITGGYVALRLALQRLMEDGILSSEVFRAPVAAVSVGIVEGVPLLDLCYAEDSHAEVDCNIVMNGAGEYVEVQCSGEGATFRPDQLDTLLGLARDGIAHLLTLQADIL